MTKSYLTTRIWKNAFSHALNENNQRLSVEYDAAWEKACSLAAKIKLDAPGLTLHDESHFEALWHDADMLVGDGFQLNAIEAFAFGMAILVHDAAHTSLAYQGGIEGLSKTPEWADNLASRLPEGGHNEALPTLGELPEELRRSVTLDTVRSLHAAQASAVLTQPFKHPSLGTEFFLIQDPTLRLHLGGIIGKIAASHHWDLAEVAKLPKLHHVTFPYSGLGGIRAQLLACLMRTSDAIQIDGSRAPDFEFALASPQGASRSHWSAQNRLAKGQDATDPTSLVINSTAPFPEPEANAWWLAYDLAGVADRELRNVDGFLKDAREPQLSITRVQNIVDPTSFANRVQTHGWYPVSAEIKVSDTAKIVDMLGGTGLYGPDNHVPLREILQNAIDAVNARRAIDFNYHGRIIAKIEKGLNHEGVEGYWLQIADDGLGMSETILTGPFLTFGESGWSSAALRRQRPGFIGKRFRRIGKFGIGFFSVFMISDEIRVTSRAFDDAFVAAKSLHFRSGLGLRPLVQDARPSSHFVTSVELFLSEEAKNKILLTKPTDQPKARSTEIDVEVARYSLAEIVGMICPAVDVEIECSDSSGSRVIGRDWIGRDGLQWIAQLMGKEPDTIPDTVASNIGLLRVIGESHRPLGRAALNSGNGQLGMYTVGGLGHVSRPGVVTAGSHVGTLAKRPDGPRRDPGQWEDEKLIARWASEQARLWARTEINDQERNFVAANACAFGGDPRAIANATIDGQWQSLEQIYGLMERGQKIFAPIRPISGRRDVWGVMDRVNLVGGFLYHQDDIVIQRANVMTAGATANIHSYWAIPNEGPLNQNGIFGLLDQMALDNGKNLLVTGDRVDYGYYNGPTISKHYHINGERIAVASVILELEDNTV